jgi:DNA polymerase
MTKSFTRIWGGVLTENVVQAIARDILAEALLRCEKHGIRIGLHIHDELVAVSKEENAERDMLWMLNELSVEPIWGHGMALGAEGKVADHYGSH